MSDEVLVRTDQLWKTYGAKDNTLDVLRGIDFEMRRGELLAITGSSGVGKSTLLNILGLLDAPTRGSLHMQVGDDMVDTGRLSRVERARIRNRSVGFVFQFYHLLPDLTVLENVLLPAMICRSRGAYRKERAALLERAHDLLTRVQVADRKDYRPNNLSGGERQRVAIARALLNQPDLLLCDEPTGNLDTVTSRTIHELFLELNQDLGTAILIVTHDEGLAGMASVRRHMVDGRFVDAPVPAHDA